MGLGFRAQGIRLRAQSAGLRARGGFSLRDSSPQPSLRFRVANSVYGFGSVSLGAGMFQQFRMRSFRDSRVQALRLTLNPEP